MQEEANKMKLLPMRLRYLCLQSASATKKKLKLRGEESESKEGKFQRGESQGNCEERGRITRELSMRGRGGEKAVFNQMRGNCFF